MICSAIALFWVSYSGRGLAHDNKFVHPFGVSDDALTNGAPDDKSPYWTLHRYFNESLRDARGYDPDALFPDSAACKPGTRGTIDEDSHFLRQNVLPYLDHFWTPWDPAGGSRNAIEYARPIFDEAVMHFAEGLEKEAFFDFGRCAHVLQDMGSVPHLFGDFHPGVLWVNASGFEKWCYANRGALPTSGGSETVTSLPAAMEALGLETYRAARIAGRLNPDPGRPLAGDIERLFPTAEYARYVPPEPTVGIAEQWWIEGVGSYSPGADPINDESDPWGPVPTLAGESEPHFYIQYNQEHVVPASVWDGDAWVPNAAGHSLAQLWAGVAGRRATPEQEHALLPRTIEYTAGYLRYLWDFVNPPPHLSRVRIEQDQDGDGVIEAGADEVICDRVWVATWNPATVARDRRTLRKSPEAPAMRLPARIDLRFSEPVRNVTVALGRETPSLVVGSGLASERGPPTDEFPDGEPRLLLPAVDLAGLPEGTITLFVTADDLSNHVEPIARALDPDPATRAGRLPNGSWRNIESGGTFPDTDRNHSFELGGIAVRGLPSFGQCTPGQTLSHAIEMRNLSLPAGTEASLGAAGSAPGWSSNAAGLAGLKVTLGAVDPGWLPTGGTLVVSCGTAAVSRLETFVSAAAGGASALTSITDLVAVTPINDHPDDTQSVTSRRYPTPWPIDGASPVGILLNGWSAGIGHLLGRYGIATAPVAPDLRILNGGGAGIDALDVLVVGSGGLAGLDRLPSFREGLARFVEGGGVLVAFTPQRGAELAALPGGRVAGFGWSEDQACFGAAARIVGRDASLAGQSAAVIDAGADGYFTRWPDDADILLERTSNGQPAMIAYRHGAGRVYALTFYPDWGYGAGQSSPAERALVRDLVTAALAWPGAVPAFLPGELAAVSVPVVNRAWADAATVSLEPRTPDRAPLDTVLAAVPLAQGGSAAVPLALTAPATAGVYPVGYRLLDGEGSPRQTTADAAFFAVFGVQDVPAPPDAGVRIWVTTPGDLVPFGGVATATVHVRNESPRDLAGAAAVTWVHLGDGPLLWTTGVSIRSGEESSFPLDYPVFLQYPFTLLYGFFESTDPFTPKEFQQRAVAWAIKGFEPFTRSADVTLAADTAPLRPGVPFPVSVRVRTTAPGSFDADVVLRLLSAANRELWAETRRISLSSTQAGDFVANVLTADGDPGRAVLIAEVRAGTAVVGQATLLLEQLPLDVAVTPAVPQAWDPSRPATLSFAVRNAGASATGAGIFTARLVDSRNTPLWSGSADLPALDAGAETVVPFVVFLPDVPLGEFHLRYAAEVPGGRFAGSRPLSNSVRLALTAAPETVADGGTLALGMTVTNTGDFVVAGTLALEAPGLLAPAAESLVLVPGAAASRGYTLAVSESTPLGDHALAARFHAGGTVTATARVVIPPAALDYLPPPALVATGEPLTIGVVNAGRNTGTFAWSARLLPAGANPDDPLVTPLAQAVGTIRLAVAAGADLVLPTPAGLASGTAALAVEARDTASGLTFPLRGYVFVRGLSATLAVAPKRPVYARGETVTAVATVGTADAALAGTSLALAVVGAGPIDPVVYDGTVVVSPQGDDTLGDGSAARPFATPQRAVDAAPAGARVLLLAGTYSGNVLLRAGTILQGEVVNGEPAAAIADADISGASGSVVDHVALRNGNIVYAGSVTDVRVSECRLEGADRAVSPRGQGIVFLQAASRVLVARNRLAGFQAGTAGVQFFGPAADVLVHENTLSGFPGAGNNGVIAWESMERLTVQGNTFATLPGSCNGVQLWGWDSLARSLRLNDNRFEDMSGDCNGLHVWAPAEGAEIRGNRFARLAGAADGIHLWETTVSATLSDNVLSGMQGRSCGIQLWEGAEPHRDVRIENNRLVDLLPLNGTSSGNGIVLWEDSERASVARNVLERVSGGDRTRLTSGIVVNGGATALTIERNVVREGLVGIALRVPDPGPYQTLHPLTSVTVANNLLTGNEVGFLEEKLLPTDSVAFRDNIVHASSRAGVLALGSAAPSGVTAVHHTDFFDNARNAEGRPDPVASDGNLSADPLFADLGGGDLRLLPGSPCVDAGSQPWLDLGPLDGDLTVVLGPRAVPPATGARTHWSTTLPLEAGPVQTIALELPVQPLDAAGSLILVGQVANSAGQVLAADAAAFTVQADPVLLQLGTPRDVYRSGETVPVVLDVTNTGEAQANGLLVRVTGGGADLLAETVSLAPGAHATLSFATSLSADTVLHATAGLAAADLLIHVAHAAVSLEVVAPEVAGDGPFPISALVRNDGRVPADLRLDLAGAEEAFTLEPGQEHAVARTASIAADTVFVARLAGDVTDAASRLVRYGPSLALRLEAPAFQPEGPALATLVLANTGSLPTTAAVSFVLEGSAGVGAGPGSREVWLIPGSEVRQEIALGTLAQGEYVLRATLRDLATTTTLRILPALLPRILGLTVAAALGDDGRLPVSVRVRNDGAALLAAELSLATDFWSEGTPIALPPGEEGEFSFALVVAGAPPGDYTAVATLAPGVGPPVAASAPLSLKPVPNLAAVPVDPVLEAGLAGEVVVQVGNTGLLRGGARLRLTCGEFHDEEIALAVDPGATALARFTVTIPPDAADSVPIAATVTLVDPWSGRREMRDFLIWPMPAIAVGVSAALDRAAYRDGDPARLALQVTNGYGGPAPLRAMVAHGEQRIWRDFTMGAPPEVVGVDTRFPMRDEAFLIYHATAGSITSSALDLLDTAGTVVSWDGAVPAGCTLTLETRTGPSATPDDTWTDWAPVAPGLPSPVSVRHDRFLQYRASFASSAPGTSPALREVRIVPADPGRAVTHTTAEELVTTPLELSEVFPVDFGAADQVFYGVYAESGRSLVLDLLPLRRAGEHLTAWTDRSRYYYGGTIQLFVSADQAGLLAISTPWGSHTRDLAGPGTTSIPVEIPSQVLSGSYLLQVDLLGENITVPVEIGGYLLRVLEARLEQASLLPGEDALLALVLQSNQDMEDATIEGWLSDGRSTREAFVSPCPLAWGLNRRAFTVPTDTLPAGDWTLAIVVSRPAGAGAPALQLAGAEVRFEMLGSNRAPTADAGPDFAASERSWVQLDGSASVDPDGDALSWRWVQVAGPAVALHGAPTARPVFLAPEVGREGERVAFSLFVSDGCAESAADSVEVAVANVNRAPVAVAGPDLTRRVGEAAALDATGSHDPDGDPVSFSWALTSRPAGSAAVLRDAARVTAALVPDVPGDYELTLTVTDGMAQSVPDAVVVSTVNSRPRADAGADQPVRAGERVELDGSASDDADGDTLTFAWAIVQRPQGSTAALDDAAAQRPSLVVDRCGTFVVGLVVHDGALASGEDRVALSCTNVPPVADAGPDRAARLGERVVLDGRASRDGDGDPLSFSWAFTARPPGSAAALDDPAAATPAFTADRTGTFALSLVVGDGSDRGEPDGVGVAVGTNVAKAAVGLRPAALRLGTPPASIRARIELPAGFSAREIDPAAAGITAVGARQLARPVRRIAAKGAPITDADRDGRPELNLHFPVRPLLRYLRAGTRPALTFKGPLRTWGRFVGSAPLRVAP